MREDRGSILFYINFFILFYSPVFPFRRICARGRGHDARGRGHLGVGGPRRSRVPWGHDVLFEPCVV